MFSFIELVAIVGLLYSHLGSLHNPLLTVFKFLSFVSFQAVVGFMVGLNVIIAENSVVALQTSKAVT